MKKTILLLSLVSCLLGYSQAPLAKGDKIAPDRVDGNGPYKRLILRGGILVTGEGAPARGPMDIVIENDRITQIVNVGNPGVPITSKRRPVLKKGDKEINIEG